MDLYKSLIRPTLFSMDPEKSHKIIAEGLNFIGILPIKNNFCYQSKFETECFGLKFPNRIGLAAGFDKNAELLNSIHLLGFGFVEVGTVTPRPQPGNPKPRIFRFINDENLLNFMGFNNDGVIKINARLEKRKNTNLIVGANIGKNRTTDLKLAFKDYVYCVKELYSNVDYFTLNISSPNTYGLRNLLDVEPLKYLLGSVQNQNQQNQVSKPILVKISPDMNNDQIIGLLDICIENNISGVIATNTTTNHNFIKGGLSGKILTTKSSEICRLIKSYVGNKLSLISSGGVMNTDVAIERLDMGCELIQLYTGLVYEGPNLVKKILKKMN